MLACISVFTTFSTFNKSLDILSPEHATVLTS